MSQFYGFPQLDKTNAAIFCQVVTSAGAPVAPDSSTPPIYSIYEADQDTPLVSGVSMTGPVNSQTGFYRSAQAVASASGFASGETYYVRGTYVVSSVTYEFDGTFCVV